MKDLLKFKNTLCCGVRHCGRVLSLIAVGLVLSSTASAKTYYIDASSFKTGLVVTFVQTQKSVDMKGSVDLTTGLITTKDFTFSTEDAGKLKFKLEWADAGICHVENISSTDIGDFDCIKILKSGANNISASAAVSGGYIQFTNHGSPVPPGPTSSLPVVQGSTRFDGAGLQIVITGYSCEGSATYNCNDAFTLVPDPDNADFKNQSDIPARTVGNASYAHYPFSHAPSSGVNKFTITHTATGHCAIITMTGSTCTKVESCTSPEPTGDAPVVYWAAYPSMGMNKVNLYGHLHTRDCNEVTGAGFYWSTSHIDVDAVKDIITTGTDTHIIAAKSPSSIGTLVAGGNFSAEDVNINMQESRVIYLVNYAKTGAGIGISDEVALSYDYCDPMEDGDVTLNQTEVKLPQGAKFKFEAIAHNAGKSPVFEWKDGETVIEGATTNTLEYEMPDTQTHTITVIVTGRCGDTDNVSASANVTTCEAPTITINPEALTSTTPWVSVPVTFTTTNVTTAEWSVTPETAELSGLTNNAGTYSGTFRAPASEMDSTPYTIEIRAKNSTCAGSVEDVKSHTINVTKDLDTCDNE